MAVESKLGEAYVEIIARMDRFERDLMQARRATQQSSVQMQSHLDGIASRVDAVNKSFISMRAIVAAVMSGGISLFVQRMITAGDEIAKTAATLGLTGEKLQELRHAASLAGVQQETLTNALHRFSRGMGESDDEVSSFQRALGRLGLRMSELKRLNFDEQIKTVSDRLNMMGDATQRNSIAFELFGRTGIRAVNFLSQGRTELERLANEARKLGLILSEDTLKKAEEANDEFDRIGSALRTAGVNIAVGFLPAIQSIRDLVTDQAFQSGVRNISSGIADLIRILVENKDKVIVAATAFAGLKLGAALGGTMGRQGAITGGILGMVGGMIAGAELAKNEVDRLTQEMEDLIRRRDALARRIANAQSIGTTVDLTTQYDAIQQQINEKRAAIAELKKATERDLSEPLKVTVNKAAPQTIFPEIDAAIKDLQFKRALLANEFRGFAEGFPELLKSLKLSGVDVVAVLGSGAGALSGQFKQLNDAMLDVQAAQLRLDIASPFEKANREIDRTRVLLSAGKISIDEFNAKAAQIQFPQLTQFIQQAGDARYQIDQYLVGSLNNLSATFRDVISGTKTMGEAMQQFAAQSIASLAELIFRMTVLVPLARSISDGLNSIFTGFSLLPSAKGNVFESGNVIPFARGGIVDRPIIFPMARGAGIMGEAGPEAVLPLRRMVSGRLGVDASGVRMATAPSVTLSVNVHSAGDEPRNITRAIRAFVASAEFDARVQHAVNSRARRRLS